MRERGQAAVWAGSVLAAGLMAASLTAFLLTGRYNRAHMQALGGICQEIVEREPKAEQAILAALREYVYEPADAEEENILLRYGYGQTDFTRAAGRYAGGAAAVGFLAGAALLCSLLLVWRRRENGRIRALTEYLEQVNTGGGAVLSGMEEGELSRLQDEIYKTVTRLNQSRDEALRARSNFAENLYNIAHQIKTPITSIFLSAQMMRRSRSSEHLEQICRQTARLAGLEEALLLLSRIDAGTLSFKREPVDVFTVLMLAADNLQELFAKAGVSLEIPEAGEAGITADLDWTMEAVMNLLKNCMEHTPPGGSVRCSYEQNPLYTQIRIWDTGKGFEKEDIPHLFERFYRGRNEKGGGIGIGLALAKAIIEDQNGTVRAENLTDGGACFEIRFYAV